MTFVAPLWLLVGLGTLVVIALHLRRSRPVEVSSLQIWRELPQIPVSSRVRSRPPMTVQLLLQLLFVLLIALALSGPRIAASELPEHRVVIIDASASMQAGSPSKFDRAIEQLGDRIALAESEGARVSLIQAGPVPRIVAARLTDPSDVLPMVEELRPSDGRADWSATQALLRSIVRDGERTMISIASDGAVSVSIAGPDAAIEVAVLEAQVTNIALIGDLVRNDEDNAWRFDGEILAAEPVGPVTVTASFQPEGLERFVNLGSHNVAAGSGNFSLDLRVPGDGVVRVAIPDDDIAADNMMLFTVRGSAAPRVLFVGQVNPHVARALAANGVIDISQAQVVPANVDDYDLAIITDGGFDGTVATNVVWLGDGSIANDPTVLPTAWDRLHPLSRGIDWPSVEPGTAAGVDRLHGSEILFAVRDRALVQARAAADGREVVIAFDLERSNWPAQSSFPLFFQNLLNWIDTAPAGASACVVGDFCDIDPRWMRATLLSPDGASVPITGAALAAANAGALPAGMRLGFEPATAGLYALLLDGRTIPVVVNAVPDPMDLAGAVDLPDLPAPVELAPWLLAAALTVLAFETLLASRSVERPYRVGKSDRGGVRRTMVVLRAVAGLALVAAIVLLPLPHIEPAENAIIVGSAQTDSVGAAISLAERSGWDDRTGVVTLDPLAVRSDIGEEDRQRPSPLEVASTAAAGDAALAMLPGGAAGRLIVAAGEAEHFAGIVPQAIARGVPISILALGDDARFDVALVFVDPPPLPRAGEEMDLLAVVHASHATRAVLTVYRDGELVTERPVSLVDGTNRIEIGVGEVAEGSYLYEIAIAADGDEVPQNDRAGTILNVAGPIRLTILSAEPERSAAFVDALALHEIEATIRPPHDAENYSERWLDYDVIALDNVPAIDLTTLQQEAIAEAVSVHGRGLLLLGGPNSFGPGGYYQTPLEDVSPISSRVPRDAPKAAMIFVLDRSGSMQQLTGTTTRLDIAKEATLEAISLLHEESEVAIIVFDSEAQTVVPLQPAANAEAFRDAIAPIEPGGGTNIYPGLVLALGQFENVDAASRHVVVLTDGLSQRGDFDGITSALRDLDVTVSTVAIGEGAERPLLETIARNGGGAFHASTDFGALPSILSQEAMMLSGSPIEERLAEPMWVERPRWLSSNLPEVLPSVQGYVLTTARDAAETHLMVEDAEGNDVPLLASWRYGSGFVAALTTQVAGAWTQDWSEMPEYALLWAQLVREASPQTTLGPMLSVAREGDTLVAQIAGAARGETVRGTVAGPDESGSPRAISFVDEGDGRHLATTAVASPGVYEIRATIADTELAEHHHVSYAAAFEPPTPGQSELQSAIAGATGGRVSSDVASLFGDASTRWVMNPVLRPWTLVALLAVLAELALRYGRFYGRRSQRPELRTNDNTSRLAA